MTENPDAGRSDTLGGARPRVAVIIPIYGRHDLTAAVLADLTRENGAFDVWLVDNQGDFEPGNTSAKVVRPGTNLGWSRGCNFGVSAAWDQGYGAFVLLNNDVRLSLSFVDGLLGAMAATEGDVVGPAYNHNWPHQRGTYRGDAAAYVGRPREWPVPFVDGTCMLIRRSVFESVGFLDDEHWPKHGWGCDKDYALRVRLAGGSIWVTERSYLNHFARQTAVAFHGYSELEAEHENDRGMQEKWGPAWQDLLYEGFQDVSRLGLIQERFLGSNSDSCPD